MDVPSVPWEKESSEMELEGHPYEVLLQGEVSHT